MTGTGWLARRWLRARAVGVFPIAVIVALGAGATCVALATADRTSGAYDDYLRRANSGDVVINPFTGTEEIEAVIRDLPGVEAVTNAPVFVTTLDDGTPRPRHEVELNDSVASIAALGSPDGRYLDMDRPIVREGRLPTGRNKAVVNEQAATAEGIAVGDTVPVSFWGPGTEVLDFVQDPAEHDALVNEVVEPVGTEEVEIVGIVALPDEVIPDDLYPNRRLLVSPDLARRYLCQPAQLPSGSTPEATKAALFPDDCASSYHYYSVKLRDGAAGVQPALAAYLREATRLNEAQADRPLVGTSLDAPEYSLVAIETDRTRERVSTASRPSVTALRVLGAAAAVVTVALAVFAVARELRRNFEVQRRWYQLGLVSEARAVVLATPVLVAVVAGTVFAVVIGLVIDIGPIGLLDVVPADDGLQLRSIAAVVTVAVAILAISAWLAVRAVRGPDLVERGRASRRFVAGGAPPPVTVGVRAVTGSRTTPPVVAGGVLLVGTLVAALVFGGSLSSLLETPRAYGWPWDVAAITGFGYGNLDLERVTDEVATDPAVDDVTMLGLTNEVTIDGEPTMTLIGFDRASDVELTLLEGVLPRRADEVAIGRTVAADLGVEVGDEVTLGGVQDDVRATVTGIVVFPTLGPYVSDRVETGRGMYLSEAAFESGRLESVSVAGLPTFLGVSLTDEAREGGVPERLRAMLPGLDVTAGPVLEYRDPVRPAQIVDARSTRTIPIVVGAVFAVVLVIGVAFVTWASVRARRRELAVLRAVGFTSRQLRRSVVTEAVAIATVALAVGIPLGVLVGRFLWRAFADDLGVLPDLGDAWVPVLLTVGAGLVLAALAALVPAWLAARAAPAPALRAA